jgi:hypothetical protein
MAQTIELFIVAILAGVVSYLYHDHIKKLVADANDNADEARAHAEDAHDRLDGVIDGMNDIAIPPQSADETKA